MTNTVLQSLQTIGGRIKALRSWLGLNRVEFARKYDIHEQNLIAWEVHNKNMYDSSADKLLEIFNSAGMLVTKEWLLEGKGLSPFLQGSTIKDSEIATGIANFLTEHNKMMDEALVIAIEDNAFSPFFEKGDHIGGLKLDYVNENYQLGHPYIIILSNDKKVVRILYQGKEKGLFTLGCYNLFGLAENPIFYDTPIQALYKIVRVWK